MCMVDDADGWKVFRSETRRAAKEHGCYECARTIAKGESYEFATGLIDDHWFTMHTCAQCVELKRWLTKVCNGYLFGGVWEDIEQHWQEDWLYHSLAFGRIIVHMRDRKLQTLPSERVRDLVDSALAALPQKVAA
jgi:hypothetical protein